MGILPDPRGSSLGSLSLPRQSSENLEKVPRIREGEGSWRSEIMNPINNDYWVPHLWTPHGHRIHDCWPGPAAAPALAPGPGSGRLARGPGHRGRALDLRTQ